MATMTKTKKAVVKTEEQYKQQVLRICNEINNTLLEIGDETEDGVEDMIADQTCWIENEYDSITLLEAFDKYAPYYMRKHSAKVLRRRMKDLKKGGKK